MTTPPASRRTTAALAALLLLTAVTAFTAVVPTGQAWATANRSAGVVVTTVKGGVSVASIEVFPDGSAGVVATSNGRIIVAKYTPGGKLNDAWGEHGIAAVPLPKSAGAAGAAAIGISGTKVVVAGTVGGDVVVARLTANGRPDTTFNGTGYRITDLGGTDDAATGLTLGSAGEPYLLASTQGHIAVVKYCSGNESTCKAGQLDHRYGKNGIARIDFGGAESGAALAVRSLGRVDVVGTTRKSGATEDKFAMAGLTPAGRLDNAFGTGGKVVTSDRRAIHTGPVMALDSSERILVAGTVDGHFAVARYTSAGAIDRTFATTGVATATTKGTATTINVWKSDITVAGTTPDGKATALRYTAGGTPATQYGTNGVAQAALGGGSADTIAGVVLDGAGRAILAGTTDNRIALLRYTTSGALDHNYG